MSERGLTADERQDFDVDEVHRDEEARSDAGPASDPDAAIAQDDSLAASSDLGPAGRPRRLRTRSKASDAGRRAADFDPTSRGDEDGEVM